MTPEVDTPASRVAAVQLRGGIGSTAEAFGESVA